MTNHVGPTRACQVLEIVKGGKVITQAINRDKENGDPNGDLEAQDFLTNKRNATPTLRLNLTGTTHFKVERDALALDPGNGNSPRIKDIFNFIKDGE